LKLIDLHAVAEVTSYAANSYEVARRIRQFWDRDARVIYPPVRVNYFAGSAQFAAPTRDYILGFGRWIPYKNLHLVVAAGSAAGVPVKIAGRGPDKTRILAAAAASEVPVELIESPSDDELRELYRNARAVVFPTFEDFGLVPVEAQAAGTPVIAVGKGGALETVIDGETGRLTESVAIGELVSAIAAIGDIRPEDCVKNAQRFSESVFHTKIIKWAAEFGVSGA
jgi:glycosyltransferase involved in cell wall biosynthesis